MNSSTSNSKVRREGNGKSGSLFRVAFVLLLFFGALEAFTNVFLVQMSKDLRRFKTYPARAAQLKNEPGLRVAFLGNSATERGIEPQILKEELRARGGTVSFEIFTADASHINTWQPMANHLFWEPRHAPDVLVVPYFGKSLQDDNILEIGRLARFFTSRREMPRVMSELPDVASKLDFVASSICATYATRARLKERVLSLLVPDYENFTSNYLQPVVGPATVKSKKAPTYRHLEQLISDARAQNCRIIFVALPWLDKAYAIEPSLPTRARKMGAGWVDLRGLPEMKPALFEDSIHMSPQGRAIFTPQLARAITPLLQQTPKRSHPIRPRVTRGGKRLIQS